MAHWACGTKAMSWPGSWTTGARSPTPGTTAAWPRGPAATDEQYERASRLIGATEENLRTIGGMGGFKLFAAAHERCEAQLRHALGDDAYAAAGQRGTDLSLDQAVAYALGEPATAPGPA